MSSPKNTEQNSLNNPTFSLIPPGYNYSKWRFAIPCITETTSGAALVFMPALVASIIELFTTGNNHQAWTYIIALCTLILFLSLNEKIGWGTCFRTIMMLERDWKLYAGSLIPTSAQRGDPGAVVAIINKDTKNVAATLQTINGAFSSIAIAIFGTLQLWILNPTLALSGLGGMIITIAVLTRISKILEHRAETFRDKIGISTSKASDIATSIRTIVGLGAGTTMLERYRTSAHDVRTSQLAYERVHSWQGAFRILLIGLTTTIAELAQINVRNFPKIENTRTSMEEELGSWKLIHQKILAVSDYEHQKDHPDFRIFLDFLPWINENAERFAQRITEHYAPLLEGDYLNHTDLRADNILMTTSCQVIIVDWPWACAGNPAFDSAHLLLDVILVHPSITAEEFLMLVPETTRLTKSFLVNTVLYAAGFYAWAAQFPADAHTGASLPALRLYRAVRLVRWCQRNVSTFRE